MSALKFPTLAEQAIGDWRGRKKTTPFEVSAKQFGGERVDEGTTIVWLFDDDTTVTIIGRGRSCKIESHWP